VRIDILTIFPESFASFLDGPVIKRAMQRGIAIINIVDIKSFAPGSFRHIDDSPFGGGPGMVMRCQPIVDALNSVANHTTHKILLSPKGQPYTQSTARELAKSDHIVLLCGHYEGIDYRAEKYFDTQLSIGDFVLTGGELAAQVIADSIVRLLPDVLKSGSADDESFENGLLEYPQYTQPADLNGDKVPDVLRSGNRKKIDDWRRGQALLITKNARPDLFEKYQMTPEEEKLLKAAEEEALSQ